MGEVPTWRRLLADATAEVGDGDDARRIVEEASGYVGADLVLHLDEPCTTLSHARWARMVERRVAGEPLQYVLGRWGFRGLDLLVDRRVLIPRPETEMLVEHALAEVDRLDATTAVDLGTGSGAIALALAVERAGLSVWATDHSPAALEVARANLAGIGRTATRVRIVEGDWFAALPGELLGMVDVVVSNPPYVADGDPLPDAVAEWEPREALLAGCDGLDAIRLLIDGVGPWLRPVGTLVLEIGEKHAAAVIELADGAGYDAEVLPDLAGRDRVAVLRRR
ncbi:MAG: peptide chain release factor N(5)-glutamine methyltransferase [Acidimicrobiales bacterium]